MLGCVSAALLFCLAATAATQSLYTSIGTAECRTPDAALAAAYADRGEGVEECPGIGDYDILLVSDQTRSWIDLRSRVSRTIWSTKESVATELPIGNFPNVAAARIEWRVEGKRVRAIIFRVVAQDREDPTRQVFAIYVVRLDPGPTAFAGRVATEAEARELADSE